LQCIFCQSKARNNYKNYYKDFSRVCSSDSKEYGTKTATLSRITHRSLKQFMNMARIAGLFAAQRSSSASSAREFTFGFNFSQFSKPKSIIQRIVNIWF